MRGLVVALGLLLLVGCCTLEQSQIKDTVDLAETLRPDVQQAFEFKAEHDDSVDGVEKWDDDDVRIKLQAYDEIIRAMKALLKDE